jgi:hypothetical protein
LASNTRPDIAYNVHQAAIYSHGAKNSHPLAVKIIIRYPKGTADKGTIFKPNKSNTIDFHIDSYLAGLFGDEDGLKPICAKSRTGYVIIFFDVPIMWVSKMQTQIALSTMVADLIAIREIIKQIILEVLNEKSKPECTSHSKHLKMQLHPKMKSFFNQKFSKTP